MLDILISTAELFGGLTVVLSLAMIHGRSRRVVAALSRYAKLHFPKWALLIAGLCLAIPGPLDEMLVIPLLALFTLRTTRNRRILKSYLFVAIKG